MRLPGASSSRRSQPPTVRNGWLALAVTRRPDASRSSKQSLTPVAKARVMMAAPAAGRCRATTPGCPARRWRRGRRWGPRPGVGPQHPGVAGQAAGLAEVGQHRSLVGPQLQLGELGQRHDRALELAGEILSPRLISDTSTWRFSAEDRPVMSCR